MKAAITCIYALTHPTNQRIYYVGQTIDFYRRLSQHLCVESIYRKAGIKVYAWIRHLRDEGLEPSGIIVEENPLDGLDQAEQRWISTYLAKREPLLNTEYLWKPQQLRLRLPFLYDEYLCFPLRQWRMRQAISLTDAARLCNVGYGLFERLEHGDYEVTKHKPLPITLEEIKKVSEVTKIPIKTLLCPSQHKVELRLVHPPKGTGGRPRRKPDTP